VGTDSHCSARRRGTSVSGLLYRGLESSVGVFVTIVLTSAAFGLLHQGFGWERLIATGCVGLLFGWVRWHTGNTSICIVAHAVMNSFGAAALTMLALIR
jgi:membrane protease YdiL (CAAX protease family)